jgi:hypothetical protein
VLTMHATAEHMYGMSKRICDLISALDGLSKRGGEATTATMRDG